MPRHLPSTQTRSSYHPPSSVRCVLEFFFEAWFSWWDVAAIQRAFYFSLLSLKREEGMGSQDWGCQRKRPIGDREIKTWSPFLGHESSNWICNKKKLHIKFDNVIANHYLKLAKDLYIHISPVQTHLSFPQQWDYRVSNVSPPPMSRPEDIYGPQRNQSNIAGRQNVQYSVDLFYDNMIYL